MTCRISRYLQKEDVQQDQQQHPFFFSQLPFVELDGGTVHCAPLHYYYYYIVVVFVIVYTIHSIPVEKFHGEKVKLNDL